MVKEMHIITNALITFNLKTKITNKDSILVNFLNSYIVIKCKLNKQITT